MNEFIPLSVPEFRGNEWKYVKECLDTGWVSSAGKYVDRFEKEIALYTGARHAVACVNGTSAIHAALVVSGVAPDDEVIVPALTFIAPVNAVRYANAWPVFMDCDDYYNIDAEKTIDFLKKECERRDSGTFNRTTGRRISAVVPVHIFGNAVACRDLIEVCREGGIRVVEDATESLGTRYSQGSVAGRHAGTVGDIGCLSFNGNKIITTGGGGMILTDSEQLAKKARYLTTQAKNDEWYYVHDEIGYNYRMTNVAAALGVAQLEQLPGYIEIKKRNYACYLDRLSGISGLSLASVPDYAENNHWLYALRIDESLFGKDRDTLLRYLDSNKIQARPVWKLNHEQKPYAGCQSFKIEKAPALYRITINIPSSISLTQDHIDRIAGILDWKK